MNFRFVDMHKKWELALIVAWAIMQCYLLYPGGMIISGEAVRVIREAHNLAGSGHFSTPVYFTYLTEISLIYLKLKLGTGFGFITAIHLLLNLFALITLYRFMFEFYSSKKIAFAGCFLLILCFPYQQYNSFLYTESIFFSLSIIYSCYLLKIKTFSFFEIIKLLLWLTLLCITRPTGIFFFGATIIYWFAGSSAHLNIVARTVIFLLFSAAGLFIVNYLMGTGVGINILLPFKEEHIICDVPTKVFNDGTVNINDNSLQGLFGYISRHPGQVSRLAYLRSKAFFGLKRKYYSFGHNLFITGFFYSLYIFSLLALFKHRRNIPVTFIYLYAVVFIFWLAVIFSCDEWHNRFFLTLTPFFILPALYFFKNKKNRQQ